MSAAIIDAGETPGTTCPYCGVGCGVKVREEEVMVAVSGDPQHPANHGRLCSKGAALGETLDLEGRLLEPLVDGQPVDWGQALETVAGRFNEIIATHGPDAVAFYVSGQLLTEDYYVANKLMKGFIGSGNIDTNSRLCMSTAVAAHKRAFGADAVPGCYEDLELADLVVIVGSNAAWAHPVLYQRLVAAKRARPDMRVVVIDPRRTPTCDIADLHLGLRPGSDAFLFNGLLDFLRREDAIDWGYLEASTEGFSAALAVARASAGSIPQVAAACGMDEASVLRFYRWFARTARTVTLFSQGINQSSSGVDKANAIINVHLATGRIGKPGACPFSITGQPNAMGGREVGGLANQLAAHMDFEDPAAVERVRRFWQASNMAGGPGLKAVDLFEAIHAGRVKAVWIMATNPVVSLPNANRVAEALSRCDFVVVSDCMRHTDTTRYADVLLPAATWGEKDGTVTNSERRISRQRAFLSPPGEARADWWIISQVAARMGFASAFDYRRPVEIFREHARLSALENGGGRAFDIGALADIDSTAYDALKPVQWPVNAQAGQGTARLYADGRFYTPTGRARLVAVDPRYPRNGPDEAYPLALNTGRIRDQWHTMTRSAKTARLTAHIDEPFVHVNPVDAASCGLATGDIARIGSRWGEMLARVSVTEEQRPGSVFAPMHWNAQFASAGRVDAVVNPATDPISGQPELKHTPVRLQRLATRWQAFALSRAPLTGLDAEYWSRVRGRGHWRHEMAGCHLPGDWTAWARSLLGAEGEWLIFEDAAAGRFRAACIREGRVSGALFVTTQGRLPERGWLGELMGRELLDETDRLHLLAGRPARGMVEAGPVVCACFNVGLNTLLNAIASDGLSSVESIGQALKAGTNCGSCVPELRKLIERRDGPVTA